MNYTDFINRQNGRRITVLTTIGSMSCLGAILTACAVRYPASDSPVAWVASCVLWAITAVCGISCIRLHSRRAKKNSRGKKCLGIMRMDTNGRWYTER